MTPPRSEAWAIVLGAGLAMLWHMAREQRNSAIRVSIYAALGGGFGFSFGNFLQVLGNVMEIPFNMWNVMEYSIGFFGGGGMAFGVFSSKWPQQENQPKNWANRLALLLIVVFIPLIVYRESLAYGHLLSRLGQIPNLEMISFYSTILAAVILILLATGLFLRLMKGSYSRKEIALLLFSYLAVYIVMSYIVTGMLAGKMILNHHLYVLNTMVIYILYKKNRFEAFHHVTDSIASKKWVALFFAILFCIAIFSLVAISIHGELPGSHNRF
jgi:hypothetical protein